MSVHTISPKKGTFDSINVRPVTVKSLAYPAGRQLFVGVVMDTLYEKPVFVTPHCFTASSACAQAEMWARNNGYL